MPLGKSSFSFVAADGNGNLSDPVTVEYDLQMMAPFSPADGINYLLANLVNTGKILDIAKKEGIKEVVEGSNLDDNGDFRPGLKAIAELNIKSPLREIGFTKEEIDDLSNYLDRLYSNINN